MPFVKLDCGILNSTLWFEREAREVFITALLMAEPHELKEPTPQIEVNTLNETGWTVPAGWYGFVHAAGIGIIHRAGVDEERGRAALTLLGSPEASSRSPEFDGRRLVRVDGGYIVLNFIKYRERDATAKDRLRRWRERKREEAKRVTGEEKRVTRNQAEAEAEVLVQGEHIAAGSAWTQWRDAWEKSGRKVLPLSCSPRDGQHCITFASRYPDEGWRAEMLSAFFRSDDPQVRKSPPSLGWFVSTWMDETDKALRDNGRKPKSGK